MEAPCCTFGFRRRAGLSQTGLKNTEGRVESECAKQGRGCTPARGRQYVQHPARRQTPPAESPGRHRTGTALELLLLVPKRLGTFTVGGFGSGPFPQRSLNSSSLLSGCVSTDHSAEHASLHTPDICLQNTCFPFLDFSEEGESR